MKNILHALIRVNNWYLKSWYKGQQILSIGTIEEIPNTEVRYLDNGIEIFLSKNSKTTDIVFQIAWMTICDLQIENSYTWYAADPYYSLCGSLL